MNIIDLLREEIQQEAITTRRMLERVPADKFSWKPHERSMTLRNLSTHVAELPGWIAMGIYNDELDFEAAPYTPHAAEKTQDLLDLFEKSLASGLAALDTANEEMVQQPWILRSGTTILMNTTRLGVVRMSISQTIHHRAQLGVFLRLLDIPIPGSYGPSADEQKFPAQ